MKDPAHEQAAREYLDRVLSAQRRRGHRGDVPKRDLDRAVKDTARLFERMSKAADRAEGRPRRPRKPSR